LYSKKKWVTGAAGIGEQQCGRENTKETMVMTLWAKQNERVCACYLSVQCQRIY